eukprot:TRINITY_DN1117_c0_g1_i1.p1 TRINITY_DN1117_c0_g1~~TRINITY_DN1117_c0_g1_i1.p1  ORF type:complete len:167 (+),score=27.54 TRINITY_DN1117_c0_g1_i1:46-546(+)
MAASPAGIQCSASAYSVLLELQTSAVGGCPPPALVEYRSSVAPGSLRCQSVAGVQLNRRSERLLVFCLASQTDEPSPRSSSSSPSPSPAAAEMDTKTRSLICTQCEGNGAVLCSQCKGGGVNLEDHFQGKFKVGATCWLCRGRRSMLCGSCNGAGFLGGFLSSQDD